MAISSINAQDFADLSDVNDQSLATLSSVNGLEIAGGGGVLVTDSFNRADSTTTLGNADTGQTWVPIDGTWGINTNAAYIDAAGGSGRSIAVVDCEGANGTLQATFTVTNTGMGLVARCTDVNNYIILRVSGGFGMDVVKRVAGGAYASIIAAAGSAPVGGDVYKLTMVGNDFEMFQNGVSRGTGSDSFNNTEVNHGMGGDGIGSTPRWDVFSFTPS